MKLKVLRFYYFWLTEGPRLPYGFSKALEIRHCWYSGTTHFAVADPGEGPTSLPLFLDQTEARRAEKNFLGDRPPPLISGHVTVFLTDGAHEAPL